METDYDQIAEQYKRSKLQPWRTHIERYTLLGLLGDVTGKSVIDLACGEGYYTRELRRHGASRVVGVDLSHGMIALAEAEEARAPLGIEYLVGNVEMLQLAEQFDVVFAAYLLNYSHSAEELTQMCRAVARLLKPAGRFLTVNNNPAEPPANFAAGRAYGYSKRIEGELVEGAPVIWQFFLPEGPFEVRNYCLVRKTMEKAFRAAGLQDARWHAPKLSPEGLRDFGQGYWAAFLACPPVDFISAPRGFTGLKAFSEPASQARALRTAPRLFHPVSNPRFFYPGLGTGADHVAGITMFSSLRLEKDPSHSVAISFCRSVGHSAASAPDRGGQAG